MKWCKLARGVKAKFLKQTDLKRCFGVLLFTLYTLISTAYHSRWRPKSYSSLWLTRIFPLWRFAREV